MHDLCYKVYDIIERKCKICDKNILYNNVFNYIDNNQLNYIIYNFNNKFIIIKSKTCFDEYIHINCINFSYFLKILSNEQKITKIIYDKLKQLNKNDINNIFYTKCFLCNKKNFRLNFDKYTFEIIHDIY